MVGKTRGVNPMKWTLLYHRIHSHLVLLLNLTRFSPRKKIYNGVTKNLKIDREKTILGVLYSKQAFLKNENVGVKMHKIGILPKGLVHDFGQKVEIFSSFLLIKNRSRKSVC